LGKQLLLLRQPDAPVSLEWRNLATREIAQGAEIGGHQALEWFAPKWNFPFVYKALRCHDEPRVGAQLFISRTKLRMQMPKTFEVMLLCYNNVTLRT
jgi:hypothetical protein